MSFSRSLWGYRPAAVREAYKALRSKQLEERADLRQSLSDLSKENRRLRQELEEQRLRLQDQEEQLMGELLVTVEDRSGPQEHLQQEALRLKEEKQRLGEHLETRGKQLDVLSQRTQEFARRLLQLVNEYRQQLDDLASGTVVSAQRTVRRLPRRTGREEEGAH